MGAATLRLAMLLICFLACTSTVYAMDPLSPGSHDRLNRQQQDRRGNDRNTRMLQGGIPFIPLMDACSFVQVADTACGTQRACRLCNQPIRPHQSRQAEWPTTLLRVDP